MVITVTVSPQSDRAFALPITVTDSATLPAEHGDYSVTGLNARNEMDFARGDDSASFSVRLPVETDATDTDNEVVSFTIGATLPPSVTAGTISTAILTIHEVTTVETERPDTQEVASVLPNAPVVIEAPDASGAKVELSQGSDSGQPFLAKVDFDNSTCGSGPSGRNLVDCVEVTLFDLEGTATSTASFPAAAIEFRVSGGTNVRVDKREGPGAPWTSLPRCSDAPTSECFTVSGNTVTVRNITSFSQFAVTIPGLPGAPSGVLKTTERSTAPIAFKLTGWPLTVDLALV